LIHWQQLFYTGADQFFLSPYILHILIHIGVEAMRNQFIPDVGQPAPTRTEQKRRKRQAILGGKTLNVWQKKFKLDELDRLFADIAATPAATPVSAAPSTPAPVPASASNPFTES
jgi:hypothetical protein